MTRGSTSNIIAPNCVTVNPIEARWLTSAPSERSISTISYWLNPASKAKLRGQKPAKEGTDEMYSG